MSITPLRWFTRHEPRIFAGLAVACWIVLTVLSLLPGTERPHTGYSGNTEHFIAYLGTGVLTALAFHTVPVLALAAPFFVASGLFEIAQLYIPGRSALVANWLASSLGALCGILIARHLARPALDRLRRP